MSGASALAAAKRRRSKVDSNRATSNTSTSSNTSGSNTNSNSGGMPPRLSTQQSFQYMWQKILQVESMVNNNTTIMKSSSSSNNNNFEVNDLRNKISMLENSVKKLSSGTTNNTVELDGSKYVYIEQFNDVMNKVAVDMQNISEKITQLSDYVSNVQNNNVVLRNMLDSMQGGNFGFDENSSVGLSVGSNTVDSNDIVVEEEDGDEGDDEDGNEGVDEDGNDDGNDDVSATPDVSSVLEKLKTLNSDEIKEEVAAELNNNITLVVEDNAKSSSENSN